MEDVRILPWRNTVTPKEMSERGYYKCEPENLTNFDKYQLWKDVVTRFTQWKEVVKQFNPEVDLVSISKYTNRYIITACPMCIVFRSGDKWCDKCLWAKEFGSCHILSGTYQSLLKAEYTHSLQGKEKVLSMLNSILVKCNEQAVLYRRKYLEERMELSATRKYLRKRISEFTPQDMMELWEDTMFRFTRWKEITIDDRSPNTTISQATHRACMGFNCVDRLPPCPMCMAYHHECPNCAWQEILGYCFDMGSMFHTFSVVRARNSVEEFTECITKILTTCQEQIDRYKEELEKTQTV